MNYKNELEQLKYTLKNYPGAKSLEYKIEYCRISSTDWTLARPKTDHVNRIVSIGEEVIEMFGADAIRVTVYNNGRSFLKKAIQVTDTYIPLLEKDKPKDSEEEEPEKEEPKESIEENQQVFLSGVNSEMQRLQDKHENEIRFIKLEHEGTVRTYLSEISALKEKLKASENECATFASDMLDMENEYNQLKQMLEKKSSEQSKLVTLGGIKLLGKAFGMKDDDIMQLSGMVLTGDDDHEHRPQEDKGGFELDAAPDPNPERTMKHNSIVEWMKSLDNEQFSRFFQFMSIVTNKPGAFDVAIEAVNQFIQTPQNTEKEETEHE